MEGEAAGIMETVEVVLREVEGEAAEMVETVEVVAEDASSNVPREIYEKIEESLFVTNLLFGFCVFGDFSSFFFICESGAGGGGEGGGGGG